MKWYLRIVIPAFLIALLGIYAVFEGVSYFARRASKNAELGRKYQVVIQLPAPAVLDKASYSAKDFEVIDVKQENPLKYTITLIPFALGEIDIVPGLNFIEPSGEPLKLHPRKIDVKPTRTKIKRNDLVDIRPPYRPFNYLLILWAALTVGALYAAWRYLKKKMAHSLPDNFNPYAKDPRPSHVIALEQIDNLVQSDAWTMRRYKFFYSSLVDIFRDYLKARFGFDAETLTTRDLIRELKTIPAFKADMQAVKNFHRSADYVKFAKAEPSVEERDNDIRLLKSIIFDTREPQSVPPGDAGKHLP